MVGIQSIMWLRRTPSRILLVLALGLTACAQNAVAPAQSPGGDVPLPNPSMPSEPITLNVWLDLDFVAADPLFQEMADGFEHAYPNVNVNIRAYVRETIPSKVRAALQLGNPPDIVQGHVFAMAAQGFAEPLDDLWAEWGAEANFLPQAMNEVTWDRVKYGVPLDI